MTEIPLPLQPILDKFDVTMMYAPAAVAEQTGVSLSEVYRELECGNLLSTKPGGGRYRIPGGAVRDWLVHSIFKPKARGREKKDSAQPQQFKPFTHLDADRLREAWSREG